MEGYGRSKALIEGVEFASTIARQDKGKITMSKYFLLLDRTPNWVISRGLDD